MAGIGLDRLTGLNSLAGRVLPRRAEQSHIPKAVAYLPHARCFTHSLFVLCTHSLRMVYVTRRRKVGVTSDKKAAEPFAWGSRG